MLVRSLAMKNREKLAHDDMDMADGYAHMPSLFMTSQTLTARPKMAVLMAVFQQFSNFFFSCLPYFFFFFFLVVVFSSNMHPSYLYHNVYIHALIHIYLHNTILIPLIANSPDIRSILPSRIHMPVHST